MEKETKKIEETKIEEVKVERKLKGFEVVEKEGQKGVYYQLEVETYGGKKVAMYLSETQKELIDIIGKKDCYVDIETRKSKENRTYEVIALHIGEEDVQDFFPKDRAFLSLAKLHFKRK